MTGYRKIERDGKIIIEKVTYYEYLDNQNLIFDLWNKESNHSEYFKSPLELEKENEELKFKLMQVEEFCNEKIQLSITSNVVACCKLIKKVIDEKEV